MATFRNAGKGTRNITIPVEAKAEELIEKEVVEISQPVVKEDINKRKREGKTSKKDNYIGGN